MRILMLLLIVLFFIVVLAVALANIAHEAPFALPLGATQTAPLPVIIIGSVSVGVVFCGLLFVIEGLLLWSENRRLRKKLQTAEAELHDLRNLGLGEPQRADEPAAPTPLPAEAVEYADET